MHRLYGYVVLVSLQVHIMHWLYGYVVLVSLKVHIMKGFEDKPDIG